MYNEYNEERDTLTRRFPGLQTRAVIVKIPGLDLLRATKSLGMRD